MPKKRVSSELSVPKSLRKTYDEMFKVKVVLESLQESVPLSELASKYEVHPNLISQWRTKFLEKAPEIFSHKTAERQELERLRHQNERLVHQIGEQAGDIDFLKKLEKVEPAMRHRIVNKKDEMGLFRLYVFFGEWF
jgi:transposase-like protein